MYHKNFYISKSSMECKFLLDKGFNYYMVRPSYKDPRKNVWFFAMSKKLLNAVDEYHIQCREYMRTNNF